MMRTNNSRNTSAAAGGSVLTREHMVVVRKSDVSDKLLMLGMIQKTMVGCAQVPGAGEVAGWGDRPVGGSGVGGGAAAVDEVASDGAVRACRDGVSVCDGVGCEGGFGGGDE